MRNYKKTIENVMSNYLKKIKFIEEPNSYLDEKLKNESITWYPTYLLVDGDDYYLFRPFSSESFLDENEIKHEILEAQTSAKIMKKYSINPKVVFITESVEDSKVLQKLLLPDDFGILHNEFSPPNIEFQITKIDYPNIRILPNVLSYLVKANNLKGPIGEIVRKFSGKYLKNLKKDFDQDSHIKKFIKDILTCDDRFYLDQKPIDFMGNIERSIKQSHDWIRDHYFHACNTMLIGFMIIDKYYKKFQSICSVYGDDIAIEYIWAIASLYHDIGFSASLQPHIIAETYVLDDDIPFTEDCIKQTRQMIWENRFEYYAKILNDLFDHINNEIEDKWIYDGFAHKEGSSEFLKCMRDSFIENGTHGAQGVLILMSFLNKIISNIKTNEERQYLYRHIVLAAISILFHDSCVRNIFRQNSIMHIKIKNYPISGLLTYIDILQDDRRDLSGSVTRPDIFKDVESENEEIIARLNKPVLTSSIKQKLCNELKDALSFFSMNGITFKIPIELECV